MNTQQPIQHALRYDITIYSPLQCHEDDIGTIPTIQIDNQRAPLIPSGGNEPFVARSAMVLSSHPTIVVTLAAKYLRFATARTLMVPLLFPGMSFVLAPV